MREFRARERVRYDFVSPLVSVFRQAYGNRAIRERAITMRDSLKPRPNDVEEYNVKHVPVPSMRRMEWSGILGEAKGGLAKREIGFV